MSHNDQQLSNTVAENIELKDEVLTLHPQPETGLPNINRILAEIGPLPREALFLGVAKDGLPVLLNLHDPLPGPLLVTGDTGSGKSAFLRSIVRSLVRTHQPSDLQYGVITNNLHEWIEIENTSHSAGVFSSGDNNAKDLIRSMTAWAHENKKARQSVLLLVDDLEAIAKLEFDVLRISGGFSHTDHPAVCGRLSQWMQNDMGRCFHGFRFSVRESLDVLQMIGWGVRLVEIKFQRWISSKRQISLPCERTIPGSASYAWNSQRFCPVLEFVESNARYLTLHFLKAGSNVIKIYHSWISG
jgi:hypothetical protein